MTSLKTNSWKLTWREILQEIEFGWQIILGTIIGFFGAAFGSVGGVGGGGIFVPMLSLVIGFDSKSSTAMSKCKISHHRLLTALWFVLHFLSPFLLSSYNFNCKFYHSRSLFSTILSPSLFFISSWFSIFMFFTHSLNNFQMIIFLKHLTKGQFILFPIAC